MNKQYHVSVELHEVWLMELRGLLPLSLQRHWADPEASRWSWISLAAQRWGAGWSL